MWILFLGATN